MLGTGISDANMLTARYHSKSVAFRNNIIIVCATKKQHRNIPSYLTHVCFIFIMFNSSRHWIAKT